MNSSQYMDKQIMGLSASGSAGGELFDLMNPQEQHGNDSGGGGVLNKKDVLPSYDFQPIRTVGSASSAAHNYASGGGGGLDGVSIHSWGSADSNIGSSNPRYSPILEPYELPKVSHEKERDAYDVATLSEVDRTVKKYADNLLHALEGVSFVLFQLEDRTRNFENSVDELKVTVGNSSGSTKGKLRQLENVVREVQTGVQALRDKHEIVEAQLQLAKLQQHQPPESPKELAQQPDTTHQHHPAPPPSYQPPPSPVAPPHQPPPNAPPGPLPPQHPAQLPRDTSHFPPPGTQHYQSPQYPLPLSVNTLQLQPSMLRQSEEPTPYAQPPPPTRTYPPSTRPPSPLTHPHYYGRTSGQSEEPAPYTQPPPNQTYPPSTRPPAPLTHPQYYGPTAAGQSEESAPFSQLPPPTQTYPPSTHPPAPLNHPQYHGSTSGQLSLLPGYGPPSGSNFSESYSYNRAPSAPFSKPSHPSSDSGGYSRLPTAKILPQGPQSGLGSGGGSGNRGPVDDVVDKVVTMGFSRDQVRAEVRKLTENGQSVDLNVVLDKLMNGGR